PAFGTGGVAAATALPTGQVKRARLQPDGKLLVACLSAPASALVPASATNSTATSITDFTLIRFLATGQLDLTYGINGVVRIHEDNLDNLSDVAMQADGLAVAVGAAAAGLLYRPSTSDFALQNSRFAVMRVLPTANCTSVSAGVEQTVCGATTLKLGPAPQPGLAYSWAVSPAVSGFSSTSAAATFTAPQPATSTTYTLTLTATSGTQCSTTDQVRITVLPAISPALAIQASATTIVAGQSVTLSVPNPQAGATYVWTGPGLQATTGASVNATPPAGTSAAQYTVTATLGTCSRAAQLLVAVAVPGTPAWNWASRHGNRGDDRTTASATDAAGNTYVTGYFRDSITVGNTRLYSLGDNDIFVAKYDAAGAVVWAQRFGGTQADQGLTVAVSAQGAMYVGGVFGGTMQVGSTTLTASAFQHMFLARLDASTGAPFWALTTTGTSGIIGNSIRSLTTTASGDVLACGDFTGTLNLGGQQLTGGNNSSWLIACLSDAGTVKWVRALGNGSNPASALHIDCDSSGNAYVVGMANGTFTAGPSTIPNSNGAYAVYLVYFSSQGQPQWARSFIGARYTSSPDVAVDAAGNAYVTCFTDAASVTFTGATAADSKTLPPTSTRTESYLACYTPGGNPVWARNLATCNATSWNIASAVAVRGGFLYAGGWFTGSNTFDAITLPSTPAGYTAFVAKYSLTTGQNIWAQQSALDACAPRDLGVDAAGNTYLAGDFGPTIAFGTTMLTSAGSNDGFVAKLGTSLLLSTPSPRAALAWQLYPNPLSSQQLLHVQLPAPMLVQAYSLYSSVGQLVQHRSVGATLQSLDIAPLQLQKGVYLLRLQTATGVLSKQLIWQ
ncbi:T9SS type A sorting domain-containing protein, partial [Hymenobacter agri]